MIIILTGPTGSGKTDTSWALLGNVRDIVFLDCDWFASLQPFSWKKESDVEMVYQAISIMIDFHIKKSHKNFVITLTSEMAIAHEKIRTYFATKNMDLYCFRLRCDQQELQRRISHRDRLEVQKQHELKNSLVQQELFDSEFPSNDIFYQIDGNHKTEQQIALEILKHIQKL